MTSSSTGWISLKIVPTLCRCFLAGECVQIDKFPLCLLLVGGTPKPDDRHVMFLEGFAGVVAEARMQGFNLARCGIVGPELENTGVHFLLSFCCVKGEPGKGKTQCYD